MRHQPEPRGVKTEDDRTLPRFRACAGQSLSRIWWFFPPPSPPEAPTACWLGATPEATIIGIHKGGVLNSH